MQFVHEDLARWRVAPDARRNRALALSSSGPQRARQPLGPLPDEPPIDLLRQTSGRRRAPRVDTGSEGLEVERGGWARQGSGWDENTRQHSDCGVLVWPRAAEIIKLPNNAARLLATRRSSLMSPSLNSGSVAYAAGGVRRTTQQAADDGDGAAARLRVGPGKSHAKTQSGETPPYARRRPEIG